MHRDARRAWAQTLIDRTLADRYRLVSLIDVGGMGAVFVAHDANDGVDVAVKTLVPGALDDVQSERLRREARRAAAVGGDGVVKVTDAGEDAVCGPFLVMEWLKGETLSARVEREGALPASECVRIAGAVLHTLVDVHARELVHRDLKPENVFLAQVEGREVVKILDFGVARPSHATGDTLTASGAVVGTPRYMAPEQARAESRVDARADLYAVGATLYTMLSGRRPFDDLDAREAMAAGLAGPPQALSSLSASIPSGLIAVVERAMQLERDARFESAGEMHAALMAALRVPPPMEDGDTVTRDRDIRAPRHPAPRARWRWALLAAGAVLMAVGAWYLGPRLAPDPVAPAEPPAPPRRIEPRQAPTPPEPPPTSRPATPAIQPAPSAEPPAVQAPGDVQPRRAPTPRRRANRPRTLDGPGRTGALSEEDF